MYRIFKCFISTSLLLSSLNLWAEEKATVQQMKGKKAILLFENDIPFSVGQKVYLGSAEGEEIGLSKTSRNLLERKNSISLSGAFASLKQEGESVSMFSLTAQYSWNWSQYEFGPLVSFSTADAGSTETSGTDIGFYADYNIDQNVPGQSPTWGLVGRFSLEQSKITIGGSSTSSNSTKMDFGLQAKSFFFSQVLALRTELVYQLEKPKDGSDITGFVVNLGLQHYF